MGIRTFFTERGGHPVDGPMQTRRISLPLHERGGQYGLGCCGYDEVEQESKPKTTSPVYALKAKAIEVQNKTNGPMQTRRISFMGSSSYPVQNPGGPA
jgi:hypothetical protein